ncbi:Oxidoreductase, aldo/keto reductase family [Olavius sp. associated proteobacterium Delta 1]|nr:Oxidoreductase, aldo/keto reductase family [Olavius sp. associated proteobacterium Delta 1]
MKYRYLGSTGIQVSSLCMGTMTFGREADKAASRGIFNQCRDAGINFFDCANVYSGGRAENILGELISDCRDELIVTSKFGGPIGSDLNARGASRRHLMSSLEASLKRLNTDYVDIYFLHHPDEHTPFEETLRALDDVVAQGKVRYTGVSNFAAWQIAKALGVSAQNGLTPFHCVQPMYNLVKRQAEVEILPLAQSENLGVISYNPLGGGILTGKYGKDRQAEQGRLTGDDMYQKRYSEQWMYDAALKFNHFAADNGYHPASLALAWVAHHPAVTAPIMGARTVEQLKDSLQSADIELSSDLYDEICRLTPSPPPATDRSEIAFGYQK